MRPKLVYQPGSSFLCAGLRGGCFTSDRELATDLWEVLSGDRNADIWHVALRSGPADLADLVLFEFDAEVTHILVRGQHISVLSDGSESARTIDGRGVRTWVEQAVPRAAVISLGVPTATALPLSAGMVHAEAFRWSRDTADAASTETRDDDNPSAVPGFSVNERATTAPRHSESANDSDVKSTKSATALAHFVDISPAPSVLPPIPEQLPEQASLTDSTASSAAQDNANEEAHSPTTISGVADNAPAAHIRTSFETRTGPAEEGYDHLFESTILRSVEDAAVRPIVEETGGLISRVPGISSSAHVTDPAAEPLITGSGSRGDHDGSTVLAGQIAVLRAAAESRPPASGPTRRLELVLSTGSAVPIDRPIIIGRLPQADRVTEGSLPHLLTVPSPDGGISRSHVRVAVGGDDVIAADLFSTNGSLIRRKDGRIEELSGGRALALDIGDVLEIGDDLTAEVRLLT